MLNVNGLKEGMKVAVEIVSDCCGIYARTMLLDGGKWYIWEETRHYKTEKSAVKAAGKLLACHKLSIA